MSPGWLSGGLLLLCLALAGGEPPGEDPVTPLAQLGARVERTAEGEVWAIDLSRAAGVNAGLDQLPRFPRVRQLILPAALDDAGLGRVAGLAALRELDLRRHTRLTAAGLLQLRELPGLRTLRLPPTTTDAGLACLRELPQLERLDLTRCRQVTDAGLAELERLESLQELSLAEVAGLGKEGLATIARRTTLKRLDLSGTPVGDAGLAQLTTLRGLESLNLAGTRVEGSTLPDLGGWIQLRELDLERTPLRFESLSALTQLAALRSLTLPAGLTSAGAEPLAALAALESLSICDSQLDDAGLAFVERLSRLRRLQLNGAAIGDAGMTR
ncbi:MAG: leucine-rich repeat domain-containing protein, partial [Planctomycetaceae bacterium]